MFLTSYANNKGADQPAHLHSLISAFVVRCLDSLIPILAMSKVSRLWLLPIAKQACLSLTWSQIPEDIFSSDMAHIFSQSSFLQAMLTLVSDVSFSELQKLIYQAVDVPADRQKIRMGFPPKILEPPGEGEEENIIALQHGDKITLEILPDPSEIQEIVGTADAGKKHVFLSY